MFRVRTLLVILAATAAAVCLSVPPAFAGPKAGSNLQFSAIALGREYYFTPQQAQDTRAREDSVGAQGERIVIVWNGKSVPDDYDLNAACNAAQVSGGQKVLMYNLRPDKNSWPSDDSSLKAYTDSLAAFDAKLFNGTGSNGQPCWPDGAPKLMWMIGNEPNAHTFCNGDQSTNDLIKIHLICAKREALLLHRSYSVLQAEQSLYSPRLADQRIYVVGGGLSSHDAPLDLLAKYLQAKAQLGYKTCDMDYFGFHPYALNATDPYGGLALEPKLQAMLKAAGCPLKVIYTEMGIESIIPGGPQDGYSYNGKSPSNVLYVSESQFVSVWQKFIQIMQGQPDVVGFMNFELDDEQDLGGWQSGLYYFSGYPKSFTAAMKPLFGSIGDTAAAKASLPPTR